MSLQNGSSGQPSHHSAENDYTRPSTSFDLVGGPFAVVESDPGVFTTLIRKMGIKGVEVDEVYDVQPWALDHLKPKGLVLCFMWKHDKHHPDDFLDPAAKDIWFANQLSDDACASLAILNVLFNCPDIDLGCELTAFKKESADMSPKMKGLAISNLTLLRDAQNSLARPADIWGALSTIAEATRDASTPTKKPARKRTKTASNGEATGNGTKKKPPPSKPKKKTSSEEEPESFHFIGYVPAHGKVWELDGLKSGPLEVGELPSQDSTERWEDIVRPALRLKMEKYGAAASEASVNGNIQFNLLALVQDRYEVKSDTLELLKREKSALERRLKSDFGENWRQQVDEDFYDNSDNVFSTLAQPSSYGPVFARDFGSLMVDKGRPILDMPTEDLSGAWQRCVAKATSAKIAVDEEVQKFIDSRVETAKRTHDYEPFIKEFITALHNEGILADILR